ncbi:DUF692 domain-containing protein [Dasania marina]|uniref:MNIO family bufferin maturase n=1 Tax=Dasania marina TaxID=471499 RepID=UPI0030D79D44|tara:strand:- start:80810 stop:81715 length:906 start_codon:yes stop_codon:yes gene_type:complete
MAPAQTQKLTPPSKAPAWFNRKVAAGLSLKPQHFNAAAQCDVDGLWFEVHPENYFMAGGPRLAGLQRVAERHPIALHGVGASLGSGACDPEHIARLAKLIKLINPVTVSEHAVWSTFAGVYFADLLPLPRTEDALSRLVEGVECLQEGIGRTILLENPSNYLPVKSEMDEPEFLIEVAQRTGCGLLLDVNNVYVSARNVGMDAHAYIMALPPELIGEIHIAGHQADIQHGEKLLIDSHDCAVADPVWQLLDFTLQHVGHVPTLLERDADIPAFSTLLTELSRVNHALASATGVNIAENVIA